MNYSILVTLWKPVVEIAVLWFLIYRIMRFLTGTRAVKVLLGIIILLIAFLLSQKLGLSVLDWLFTKLFGISVIAILVIFHPEIRQGLAQLGQRHLFAAPLREEELDLVLKEIAVATEVLCRNKLGALIAIEKNDPLTAFMESGVLIDGRVSADLIEAVFTPNNPLHDGGMIIRQGRIIAAGSLFPLEQNKELSRIFGTRHRAALGLSQETDAIIIIVSEERQDISLVYRGRLYKDVGKEDLVLRIKEIIKSKNA